MTQKSDAPKRLNKPVRIGEVVSATLDPIMRKRGFASRDLLTHWKAIAPVPYDEMSMPDRLQWPRREAGAGGAVLILRCAPGHALALAHDAPKLAAAINRYFGYVLVSTVKLSAEPFRPYSGPRMQTEDQPDPRVQRDVAEATAEVQDDAVRKALQKLGLRLLSRKPR